MYAATPTYGGLDGENCDHSDHYQAAMMGGSFNLNRAEIIGRLGQDPELRYTGTGRPVCNMNIATTMKWQDKDSKAWNEKTQWHRIVVWGKLAERCKVRLTKGSYVYVRGHLETSSWEDRDGNKKYRTDIVAKQVGFLEKKDEKPDMEPPYEDSEIPDHEDIPF